jgi:hypothetical protein
MKEDGRYQQGLFLNQLNRNSSGVNVSGDLALVKPHGPFVKSSKPSSESRYRFESCRCCSSSERCGGDRPFLSRWLSVLVSYALEPPVGRLEGWHVPRAIGVPLVVVTFIGGIGLTTYELRGEAQAFAARVPDAAHKVAQAISHRKADASGTVGQLQAAATELEGASTNRQPPRDQVASVRIEEPMFKWGDCVDDLQPIEELLSA